MTYAIVLLTIFFAFGFLSGVAAVIAFIAYGGPNDDAPE